MAVLWSIRGFARNWIKSLDMITESWSSLRFTLQTYLLEGGFLSKPLRHNPGNPNLSILCHIVVFC